ncbi:MAG: hypothetical protein Q6362_010220 [Candidatus Wukongarchaeota archaeon]|nr:hypothetical protein [Candidatus Wukongarchaeota archaeon]
MTVPSNKTSKNPNNKMVNTPIIERIKEGFDIWKKGWLSFILALIILFFVLLIAALIIIVIVIAPILLFVYLFGDFEDFEIEIELSGLMESLAEFVGLILVITAIFIAIGVMCGLGKELIEVEDTKAENTLHYLKKYGLKFAAIGFIIGLVVGGPLFLIDLLLDDLIEKEVNDVSVLSVLAGIVAFFLIAPFTLAIPAALIDDTGPVESVKTSVNLFRKDPKTILLLFGAFVGLVLAFVSPIIVLGVMLDNDSITVLEAILAVFAALGILVIIFVLPYVMCITFTKLYYDYRFPEKKEVSEEEAPVSLL